VQPVGLVDLKVFKKRLFFKRLFNRSIEGTSTPSCDRLFHRLITRCEKNWRLTLKESGYWWVRNWHLYSPAVLTSTKDYGTAVKLLNILDGPHFLITVHMNTVLFPIFNIVSVKQNKKIWIMSSIPHSVASSTSFENIMNMLSVRFTNSLTDKPWLLYTVNQETSININ